VGCKSQSVVNIVTATSHIESADLNFNWHKTRRLGRRAASISYAAGMKTIVVATDLKGQSEAALMTVAIRYRRSFGAAITLAVVGYHFQVTTRKLLEVGEDFVFFSRDRNGFL
jgi:hypothetical protein